jgi:FkbM family methyltransferase
MVAKTKLRIIDDVDVVVPDSLDLITPYVLCEQGDWFEDEVRFVRLFLKPRQAAIDIGANYGVFTLPMAKVVGPEGRIWAFEPATSTAAFLAESVDANGFAHVTLDRRALSEKAGTAQLSLNDNSELNELIRDSGAARIAETGIAETVALTTLDDAMERYQWSDIAFLKIDAEGEEAAIIRGGSRFFRTLSPLVQYEINAGQSFRLDLIKDFQDIGYSSYRLVPGLAVLVPFDGSLDVDPYQLNLFCCKPDRARAIASSGRLHMPDDCASEPVSARAERLLNRWNADSAFSWNKSLTRLPYGRRLATNWRQTVAQGNCADVERGIALHAISQSGNLPLSERASALGASFEILLGACSIRPDFLRLASLARVAREFGARSIAVAALSKLLEAVSAGRPLNPAEPFLALSKHYERLDPKEAIANWILCSILEELERAGSYSSFYTGLTARKRLEVIRDLGFGSPEMARRLELVNRRYFGSNERR